MLISDIFAALAPLPWWPCETISSKVHSWDRLLQHMNSTICRGVRETRKQGCLIIALDILHCDSFQDNSHFVPTPSECFPSAKKILGEHSSAFAPLTIFNSQCALQCCRSLRIVFDLNHASKCLNGIEMYFHRLQIAPRTGFVDLQGINQRRGHLPSSLPVHLLNPLHSSTLKISICVFLLAPPLPT